MPVAILGSVVLLNVLFHDFWYADVASGPRCQRLDCPRFQRTTNLSGEILPTPIAANEHETRYFAFFAITPCGLTQDFRDHVM